MRGFYIIDGLCAGMGIFVYLLMMSDSLLINWWMASTLSIKYTHIVSHGY